MLRELITSIPGVICIVVWIAFVVWATRDGLRRGAGFFPGAIALLFGPLGAFLWWFFRPALPAERGFTQAPSQPDPDPRAARRPSGFA